MSAPARDESLEAILAADPANRTPNADGADGADGVSGKSSKPPQSAVILKLAEEAGVESWATPAGDPYISISVDGHREHHRLGTRASRDYLARLFYMREGKAPGSQALQDALGVLRGDALFGDGERVDAHVRHAAVGDTIYVDLADPEWRAIEVDADGWRIVADPPVRFRRPRGMLPLPEPTGGSVDDLRQLLNVGDEDWPLVVGWLFGTLAPPNPYPILGLHGEHGTAKSSAARLLRDTVDPNTAALRSEPRDERDLVIAAGNGRIIALDNVSRLSSAMSDSLCRLATGGGFATRELHTDSEEVIFAAMRPAIITGINEVATRGDLLDRSILVTLEPIAEDRRLTESSLRERWTEVAPGVLGALLDAASKALGRRHEVDLDHLPRMADHCVWVEAAAPAFGWEPGKYLDSYDRAREDAVETSLDASPLTGPIRALAAEGFEGTASDLLELLSDRIGDGSARAKAWPRSASSLSSQLRRLAPDLRADGIELDWTHRGSGSGSHRVIVIQNSEGKRRQSPSARQQELRPADGADTADDDSGSRSDGCASHPDAVAGCRYCQARLAEEMVA